MVPFNIRETANELLQIIAKELRPSGECRLTIDVLIPELIKGDKEGLSNSILLIYQYFDSTLRNYSVNIELSRKDHSGETLYAKIDIKATIDKRDTAQQFLNIKRTDIDALLARLPYPTTFSANGSYIRFSFTMLFFAENISNTYRKAISGKKVLLAEDDDMTALVFTSFMEEWEYIVTRVSDGLSAVDAARLHHHDIILMDTFLPKMSAVEAIRKIREWDKKIPIIAVTTSPIDKDFADRYAGANDVLIKPVDSQDLQKVLRRYS